MKSFEGAAATVGNGVIVALLVDSPKKVDRVHRNALKLGGKDEVPVGPRGEGFYAGSPLLFSVTMAYRASLVREEFAPIAAHDCTDP